MKPNSLAVIESPATTSSTVEDPPDCVRKLTRVNDVKLEVFTLRLAWGFATVILLLIVVSLLLVVAGYAGSIFASGLQPKAPSSSWAS